MNAHLSNNRAILVMGMHRSGTSVLTGVLHHLGVNLSDCLMPTHEDNPSGYWEHLEIVEIHDQLFGAFGSCWHDVSGLPDRWWLDERTVKYRKKLLDVLQRDFSDSKLWGVKDPRLCRLLPLWLPLLQELGCEPVFLVMGRNPWKVARSLQTRDHFSESKSLLLWLEHMLEAERGSRGFRRAFVTYEDLMADWLTTMDFAQKTLALPWPIHFEKAAPHLASFIQPRSPSKGEPAPDLAGESRWIRDTWTALQAAPRAGESALSGLDRIQDELLQATRFFAPEILNRAADLQARLNRANEIAASYSELYCQHRNLEISHQKVRQDRIASQERLRAAQAALNEAKVQQKQAEHELKRIKSSIIWKLLRPFLNKPRPEPDSTPPPK